MKKISEGRTKVGVGNHLTWKKKELTIRDLTLAEIHKQVELLSKKRRAEVEAVVKKFRKLTSNKQRDYGTAALFLVAVLEQAIAREKRKR